MWPDAATLPQQLCSHNHICRLWGPHCARGSVPIPARECTVCMTRGHLQLLWDPRPVCVCAAFAAPAVLHNVSTFSSYDPPDTMKCPGSSSSPLRDRINQFTDTLPKLNWLLNTYSPRGQGFAPFCTLDTDLPPDVEEPQNMAAGTYGPITGVDMQAAVWSLTGG